MDLGPDGNCAMHECLYGLDLNGVQWGDGSHGGARDFSLLLDRVGLEHFWVLMMTSWNLPHGDSKHRDSRFHQWIEATRAYFSRNTPQTAVLFQANVNDINDEMNLSGIEFPSEQPRDVEIFNIMKETHATVKKDRRCSFARFLSAVSRPMDCLGTWAQDRFMRQHLAIECDMLRGKKCGQMVSLSTGSGGPEAEFSHTNSKILDVVDRSVRDSCANAVAVSVMMLSKPENKRICQVVLMSSSELKKWEGSANKELRSETECASWAIVMCSGSFMHHLNQIVKNLVHPTWVNKCGFVLRLTGVVPPEVEAQLEAEFAEMAGKLVTTLVGLRLKRGLFSNVVGLML